MKILLLTLALSVTVFSQQSAYPASEKLTAAESEVIGQLLLLRMETELCKKKASNTACGDTTAQLATLYSKIAQSPRLIRSIVADAVFEYQQMNATPNKSAPQVSQIVDQQNAELIPLLVIQNQRIIELLETIAKKPR